MKIRDQNASIAPVKVTNTAKINVYGRFIKEASVTFYIIDKSADLMVVKTCDKSQLQIGELLTYTLKVTNNGPFDATNVILKDLLPQQLEIVFINAPSIPYIIDNGIVTFEIGSLEKAEIVLVTIAVKPSKAGTIENFSWVSASEFDPNPYNNYSKVAAIVVSPPSRGIIFLP
ncbi:repeat protein [Clostridiales bacterium oral taxon 876 str. F0540]|nr:repeat protein [Clostridiales bacterium oral taxon 876 str. F0540]